jgi:hypothetical protein
VPTPAGVSDGWPHGTDVGGGAPSRPAATAILRRSTSAATIDRYLGGAARLGVLYQVRSVAPDALGSTAMVLDFHSGALCLEIMAVYGVALEVELSRDATSNAAMVAFADRVASAIHAAGGAVQVERTDGATIAGWTPLPIAPDNAAPASVDELTARLIAWARAGGAELAACEVRTTPQGYRTAHAARAIGSGERVLCIPRALMLDSERAQDTPTGRTIVDSGRSLGHEHSLLATVLLAERADPASPWRPFLDTLPSQLAGLPVYHDAARLAVLDGSAALARIRQTAKTLGNDHAQLVALFPELDLAAFAWARAICSTRCFGLTIGDTMCSALVPIADTADHGEGDVHWTYNAEAGDLVITAARDFAAGDEIRLSYGKKSNARLFTSYGFCVADNPHDVTRVIVPRDASDARIDLLARVLWSRPLAAPWDVTLSKQLDGEGVEALSLARIAAATPSELLNHFDRHRRAPPNKGVVPWLGARNEAAALALLAEAARTRRSQLPVLEPGSPLALLVAGERDVLDRWLGFLAEAAPIVADLSAAQCRRLADAAGDGLLVQYLRKLADELT